MPAPVSTSTNTVTRGRTGSVDPYFDDVFALLPTQTLGFSTLGRSGLQAIADLLPFVDYRPDNPNRPDSNNELIFITPSIVGYDVRAYVSAEFSFGVDFDYHLDVGQLDVRAVVTSAISIEDNDPFGGPVDPDGDVYTSYIFDTSRAGIRLLLNGTAATTNSEASLVFNGSARFGILGAGLYDDGNLLYGGNIINFNESFSQPVPLFDGLAGSEVAGFDASVLSGRLSVPSLPTLGLDSGGATGLQIFDPVSASGTGPQFATLTFDPIPLVPVLGEINENTFFLIRSYLLDAGLQYKLITTELELGAALRQNLTARIDNIGVSVEVQEQPIEGGPYSRLGTIQTGQFGDQFVLNFSTGDRPNTLITETYTINVHVDSSIDLVPILSLHLGLGFFSAFINPILIDELRASINLYDTRIPIEIASITVAEGGFDVQLIASVVTQIDTHLPVVGTIYSDNDTIGPDGMFHQALRMAGDQIAVDGYSGDDIVYGNPSANRIAGGTDNDLLLGEAGDDVIHGGAGFDTSSGGDGNDRLYTDAGGTGPGGEGLSGGDGNDGIYVSAVAGIFSGDAGNDFFEVYVASGGNQQFHGGSGIDSITLHYETVNRGVTLDLRDNPSAGVVLPSINIAGVINTVASTFDGFEQIFVLGSNFADTFYGSDEYNFIAGGGGADQIFGFGGNDLLGGNAGDDIIFGMIGNDIIIGEAGNDQLFGNEGNDNLQGGDGNDLIQAGTGVDLVTGGEGDDTINDDAAENADDNLAGGGGNDRITGGGGRDTIHGNDGNDILTASSGGGSVL